jgi:hypothetical protein
MAYSSISEYAYNEIAVVMDGRSVEQALSGTNGSSVYNNVADDGGGRRRAPTAHRKFAPNSRDTPSRKGIRARPM